MDFARDPGGLWYRMKALFALWVMTVRFDAEHTVPRCKKNILSLKATLHFPNLITA